MNNFDEDLAKYWEKTIATYGIETIIPKSHEFGEMLDEFSRNAEAEAHQQLQPWLYLADQFIYWLAFFNFTLMGMVNNDDNQDKDFSEILGSLSVITSLAASQAISIRKLCILGHDASARIILRSLTETIDISLMVIHDSSKRKEYFQSQDFDEARTFWSQNLRKSKLSTFYKSMFQTLGYPENAALVFQTSRENVKELTTQATHSSWHSALFSAIPVSYSKDENAMGTFFGTISQFSKSTLFHLCESILFLSEFGYSYLLHMYGKKFTEFVKLTASKNSRESVPLIMFNLSSVIKDLYLKYYKEFHEGKDDSLEKMAEYIFNFKK